MKIHYTLVFKTENGHVYVTEIVRGYPSLESCDVALDQAIRMRIGQGETLLAMSESIFSDPEIR